MTKEATAQHPPMDIYSLLDELQTIARNGLNYCENGYDCERYERLLQLATRTYADLMDLPQEQIKARFKNELGYITPKVGADAAIFNQQGEILLMERADGSGWCLPCGWIEPNEKPAQAIVRETLEETGLEIEVQKLLGVFTRLPAEQNGPHTMIALVYLCKITGGELTLSHEGLALRYWPIDEVPHWHATHEKYAQAAYRVWASDDVLLAVSD